MNTQLQLDVAKLILRLTSGGLMIFHGIHKLIHGHDFIALVLTQAGLPEFFKFGVPVGEVIAPVLMILGIFVRPAAVIAAFTMLVSIPLAYSEKVFTLNQHGGWIVELNFLFFAVFLAIAFLGGGKFSLSRREIN